MSAFEIPKNRPLSVIVPVYNEGLSVLKHLELLVSELEPYFERFEIIVVSDGSTDQTNLALQEVHHPAVRVICLERNFGKGYAVRRGFQEAKGDFVLFIDGGMELHPKEIRIFLGLMHLYEADIVVGSKRHPQSQVDYPWYRRLLSMIFQLLLHRLFSLDVTDTQVGIKMFKKEVLDAILPDLEINRYGFDIEVLALAQARGFGKMLEAPVRLDYFSRNTRKGLAELLHVFRVGLLLIGETWKIFQKIRSLEKVPRLA